MLTWLTAATSRLMDRSNLEVDGPLGVLCKCGAAVHMRDMVDIMVQDWTKTCCIVCDRRSVVGWK